MTIRPSRQPVFDAFVDADDGSVPVYDAALHRFIPARVATGGQDDELFDLDTATPAGAPLNGVYRIRHGFDNFLGNSAFEHWTDGTTVAPNGWTLFGDATIARSSTSAVGVYSAEVTFGTANTGELYQPIPTSTLVDYTFSCYVQRTSGTGTARLVAQDGGGSFTEFVSVDLPTTAGWQLVALTVKPASGTMLRFSIKSKNGVASTWLVDECMFEESKGIASTWTEAMVGDTFDRDIHGTFAMHGGVTHLPEPVDAADAATKNYVDVVGDALTYGEEVPPRVVVTSDSMQPDSGTLTLGYFTARKPFVLTKVRACCGSDAAVGATLIRFGLYTIDGSGAATLVASTPNDAALFGSSYTVYTKNLSAPYTAVVGQRYALGLLVVAGTAPKVFGSVVGFYTVDEAPRTWGFYTGRADLPSSFAASDLAGDYRRLHLQILTADG